MLYVDQVIVFLKEFENKEKDLKVCVVINLFFLYFLEGDIFNVEKYVEVVVKINWYNVQVFVNKGNCLFNWVCLYVVIFFCNCE